MLVQVVMAVLEVSHMPVESCQLVPGEVCRELKTESVILLDVIPGVRGSLAARSHTAWLRGSSGVKTSQACPAQVPCRRWVARKR